MKKPVKIILTVLVALVTLANGLLLGYSYNAYRKSGGTEVIFKAPPLEEVKQEVAIVGSKAKRIDESQLGVAFAQGKYEFETLEHSKYVSDGTSGLGQLALATHEASKAHFVLALGVEAKLDQSIINDGWKLQSVSIDQMWQPGGCASKPTQLLSGRYIFVDDGKTDPNDLYGSYIFFDIQSGTYKYFGGSHFTKQQGEEERIVKVANENEKVVFYIDLRDEKYGENQFEHSVDYDHGYVIRRVIDPDTLEYVDYKMALDVPEDITIYNLYTGYGDNLLGLSGYNAVTQGAFKSYVTELTGNRFTFTEYDAAAAAEAGAATRTDSPIELAINQRLTQQLASFVDTDPPSQYVDTVFSTNFSASVIGSFDTTSYLIVSSRKSYKEVPVVYDSAKDSLDVLTNSPILASGNYVSLGVY